MRTIYRLTDEDIRENVAEAIETLTHYNDLLEAFRAIRDDREEAEK